MYANGQLRVFLRLCFSPRTRVIMDFSHLNMLSQQLEDARKSAELLQAQVSSIMESIKIAQKQLRLCIAHCKSHDSKTSKVISSNTHESQAPPLKKVKYDFQIEGDYVVVYTDGACSNNGKPNAKAGIGVWFDYSHPLNVSKPVQGRATNNTAEIQACTEAIQVVRNNGISKLKIRTDSQFVINSITKWMPDWKKRGWKLKSTGKEVKNKEDFQKLDSLCSMMTDIKWEYVPGHSDNQGNIQADSLAVKGAEMYKPNH